MFIENILCSVTGFQSAFIIPYFREILLCYRNKRSRHTTCIQILVQRNEQCCITNSYNLRILFSTVKIQTCSHKTQPQKNVNLSLKHASISDYATNNDFGFNGNTRKSDHPILKCSSRVLRLYPSLKFRTQQLYIIPSQALKMC